MSYSEMESGVVPCDVSKKLTKFDETGGRIFKHKGRGRNIMITEYREHCYMLVSFNYKEMNAFECNPAQATPCVSFVYWDGGNKTVEWGPPHGPISINTACGPDEEHTREDPFIGTSTNDWSQLAVENNGLAEHACYSMDGVFKVLKDWITPEEVR